MDNKIDILWWESDENDVATDIFNTVRTITEKSDDREQRNIRCAKLYGNREFAGVNPRGVSSLSSAASSLPENRVKINIISSMCDTAAAKISKMKPRVTFLTTGGDWTLQQNTKKLTTFMNGLFYKNDVHKLHQVGFRDSTIFDIGALKHFIQNKQIVTERVIATELVVDPTDAMYGKPRSLYQFKYVHKNVLKAHFKKHAAGIDMSAGSMEDAQYGRNPSEQFVVVIEAWHLPSAPGAKDGRHIICTSHAVLSDTKWDKDYFPFTFFRWSEPLTGFYGQALAERLTGNQIEINKMLRIIQRSFHLGSAFKVFIESGSKIVKEHINNEVGSIVYYTGTKPDYYVPQTVHPEYFRHLEFLISSSYEEAGISQLSASARKPAGIESGKAMREYNDIETERFAITSQGYESSFLTTAKIYVDLLEDLRKSGADYEVVAESKKFVESIKWSDTKVEGNEIIMQMFPTSALPQSPAGRMQWIQELVNGGFIPQEFAIKLLDFPDIESYTSLINASLDDLLATIEDIVDKGKYTPPEPYQDLQTGLKLFQSAYLKAKRDEVPEKRLDLLRRWMTAADAMIMAAQPQQPPAAAPEQGAPAPAPMPEGSPVVG